MTKGEIREIINHVNQRLDKTQSNNIAIFISKKVTDENIKELAKHFKVVRRQPFGYIHFEREEMKLLPNAHQNLYWWTVQELRAECHRRHLPDYGHKKELIERLKPGMGLRPPYAPKPGMVWDPIESRWVTV